MSDAEELGATTVPPTHYVYRYHCSECSTTSAEVPTAEQAQSEGWSHQMSAHPPAPTYTVQEVGKYA